MLRTFTSIILFIILATACGGKKNDVPVSVRDTTITRENAFTNLFLDSLAVDSFIVKFKLNDSAAFRLRNFYNTRNYQFAWFTQDGLAEQGRAFWNLHNNFVSLNNDSSLVDKKLHEQMRLLIEEDEMEDVSKEDIVRTELHLTVHFFDYAQYAYTGTINPEELQWHIPRKQIDPLKLLDSLVATKGKQIEQWEPVSEQYKLMQNALARFNDVKKSGGWGEVEAGEKKIFRQGDSARAVVQVKQRLQKSGDYTLSDATPFFNTELLPALQQAQLRFGLKQDGVIGPNVMAALNVPVEQRIKQLMINMERMRWMPRTTQGTRLVANIPEYKVHVFEGKNLVFDMDIVVGTAANKTVVFNDEVKYVVFSPYWNIPRSIVRGEILPAMRRNSNYLARNNMEQTGYSNGLPVIRQKPGPKNALGKVKFIFPNSYSIYFHDTPAKSLFERESRAFSHGCIRLAEPRKMAEYLLRDQSAWDTNNIIEAMNAPSEKWVTLQEPVPVFISYFTSWVDQNGLVNFRDDIYGHDKKMAERLFVEQEG